MRHFFRLQDRLQEKGTVLADKYFLQTFSIALQIPAAFVRGRNGKCSFYEASQIKL